VYVLNTYGGLLRTIVRLNPQENVVIKTSSLSPAFISSFVVFGTVLLGLRDLAKVKAGETVLIHGAAGGVGQAAIKFLQHLGATIIASCSKPKQPNLRELFGLELFIDSRAPELYYSEVMKLTKGAGVNVVLNSVSGKGLTESLRCLSHNGRFVEIGKVLPFLLIIISLSKHLLDVL
jgi:NADPH:quinone reductase-like Zn-dependent oxidoreductase